MTQEDYCSFEVAKLLKEKGFNWDCITYYVDYEPDNVKYSMLFENNTTWEKLCCSAPTHQMAMKWLREEHKIFIRIVEDVLGKVFELQIYQHGNCKLHNRVRDSYEEAVEVALKYVLENLI